MKDSTPSDGIRGHVGQAQQVFRRLIKGRLTLTPQTDGYYTFMGVGTVRPLLAGAIRNVASPHGTDERCTLTFAGFAA